MVILLYGILALQVVVSILLMIRYKTIPSILRTLVSFALVYTVINFFTGRYIQNFFWISTNLPEYYLLSYIAVGAIFIATLFEFFDMQFKKNKSIPINFVAALLVFFGLLSIFTTGYDLFFYLLISIGGVLLLNRFVIQKYYSSRAYWLSLFYYLPIAILSGFVLLRGNFVLSPLNANLLSVKLLGVNFEMILIALVIAMTYLTIYLLSWEFLSKPFKKLFSRVRIQQKR